MLLGFFCFFFLEPQQAAKRKFVGPSFPLSLSVDKASTKKNSRAFGRENKRKGSFAHGRLQSRIGYSLYWFFRKRWIGCQPGSNLGYLVSPWRSRHKLPNGQLDRWSFVFSFFPFACGDVYFRKAKPRTT